MKKGILIVIIVAMLGWSIYEFVISTDDTAEENASQNVEEVGLRQGQIAPDFKLETLEGETVNLSDYRGTPVLINFWATWCPPCRAEIPDLQQLYDEEDVVVLAVNMTESEQNEETVEEFVDEFQMTFPVVMDVEARVTQTYKVQAYPTSYMIDEDGHIQFVALGAMNYEQMKKELEKIQ